MSPPLGECRMYSPSIRPLARSFCGGMKAEEEQKGGGGSWAKMSSMSWGCLDKDGEKAKERERVIA